MCNQTSTVFGCGHQVYRTDTCPTADASRKSKDYCAAILTYPARQSQDSCLGCWTKKMGLVEVSDMPKGKDDLPRSREPRHVPVHHSRKLYRSLAPSGDPEKDTAIMKWTPQGHRYDPERKKWALHRSKMPRPEDLKRMKQLNAQKAPAAAQKKKVAAPKKQQPKAKTPARGKK